MANAADAKLMHLVRKCQNTNLDTVLQQIVRENREYQRKNVQQLKTSIAFLLDEIAYEEAAAAHDNNNNMSNTLNDSLTKSYREMNTEETTNKKKKKRRRIVARSSSSSSLPGGDDPTALQQEQQSFLVPRPTERYSDLGGMQEIVTELRQICEFPLKRPEVYDFLGITHVKGILLRGPPGTGKTHLANAIAGELEHVSFFRVAAPQLVSGISGNSEANIRNLFDAANRAAPSLVFMDELDVICGIRNDESKAMEQRMVASFLTCFDALASNVIVIGATNRPDALDPALRRAGRFDKEIFMNIPNEPGRIQILQNLTRTLRMDTKTLQLQHLARRTPGFTGADLKSLVTTAATRTLSRIFSQHDIDQQLTPEQLDELYITQDDFESAIPHVQASTKRQGFCRIPDVTWNDIGALDDIRQELHYNVILPIHQPERFQKLGLSLPAGVLLYGPPGCGKTLLAQAVANESQANFISIKGPELLDKYVGESEHNVRRVFERARASAPCIIFFDELDSLTPRRGNDSGGGNQVSERVVNQLLLELDGVSSNRKSIFVIAATNRPELVDPAMLRPGRLDKILYVQLPKAQERLWILQKLSKNISMHENVDFDSIANQANGYSGADCAALLREAGLTVLKENGDCIQQDHLEFALTKILPSVSKSDELAYNTMRDRLTHARSRPSSTIMH